MSRIAELDSFDLGWFILFIIPATCISAFAVFVTAGNKVLTGSLFTVILLVAAWLLLAGLSRWQTWWVRLGLMLAIATAWLLVVEGMISFFGKGIC